MAAKQFAQNGNSLKIQTDGASLPAGHTKVASYSTPTAGKLGPTKTDYHFLYESLLLKNKGLTNMQNKVITLG